MITEKEINDWLREQHQNGFSFTLKYPDQVLLDFARHVGVLREKIKMVRVASWKKNNKQQGSSPYGYIAIMTFFDYENNYKPNKQHDNWETAIVEEWEE